jgi:hypothetical protein
MKNEIIGNLEKLNWQVYVKTCHMDNISQCENAYMQGVRDTKYHYKLLFSAIHEMLVAGKYLEIKRKLLGLLGD